MTCPVTVYHPTPRDAYHLYYPAPCGAPVVDGRLCARHAADRARLGGAA